MRKKRKDIFIFIFKKERKGLTRNRIRITNGEPFVKTKKGLKYKAKTQR